MTRPRVLDTAVAAVAVLVPTVLVGGWYAVGAVTPVPRTPVGDQAFQLGRGSGESVTLHAPQGWDRVPTGDSDVLKFVHAGGGVLLVELTTGYHDFAIAAPRRLRELAYSGVNASFTGPAMRQQSVDRWATITQNCDATVAARVGQCAVAGRTPLLVTVVTIAQRGAPTADVGAVIDSLKGVQ